MKFKSIEKIHSGKFITRYDIHYETESGKAITYEMISREPDVQSIEEMRSHRTNAVVLVMHDESKEHILLCKEFREGGEFPGRPDRRRRNGGTGRCS